VGLASERASERAKKNNINANIDTKTYLIESLLQPLQLFRRVGVVQEQPIVQVERIIRRILHQRQQTLVSLGINIGPRQIHRAQRPPHRVRDELRARRRPIVLLARHLHHPTPFLPEKIDEPLHPLVPLVARPHTHAVVHEIQTLPAALARVWPKHRVRAQDVHFLRQRLEEQIFRKDLRNVYSERMSE